MRYMTSEVFGNDAAADLVDLVINTLVTKAMKSREFGEARAARELLGVLLYAFPGVVDITEDEHLSINNHIRTVFAKLKGDKNVLASIQKLLNEEEQEFTESFECSRDPDGCGDADDADEDEDYDDNDDDDDD